MNGHCGDADDLSLVMGRWLLIPIWFLLLVCTSLASDEHFLSPIVRLVVLVRLFPSYSFPLGYVDA